MEYLEWPTEEKGSSSEWDYRNLSNKMWDAYQCGRGISRVHEENKLSLGQSRGPSTKWERSGNEVACSTESGCWMRKGH